uniref:Ig-like domain-containing protein n=1 Tax=Neovison vison TaxID=452646 RepID=A0A8C7B8R2_NEOVI
SLWSWDPGVPAGFLQGDPGYELRVQGTVTVQDGLCVHVPCSFSYPGLGANNATHVYGSWYRLKDNPRAAVPMATKSPVRGTKRKGLHLSGDPGAGDCSLSITDAQRRHSGNYYFHLYRGLMRHRYGSNRLTVRVTALTQTPDIQVKEPLESGRPSYLTCSVPGACDGATPFTISWMGAALGAPGLNLEASNSSEILLTPHPQDHGTNLTCRVTFPRAGVSTQSTITLNVSCACRAWTWVPEGWIGEAQRGSLPVLEGETLLLVCAADSNPPATLSWVQGSQTLGPSWRWEQGLLELPRVELGDESKFTCQAQNPLGSRQVSLHLSVVYPPRLLSPSCSWEGEGLHCNCSSRAQPAPTLRWRLGEELLEGNHSNASWTVISSSAGPWANSSLSLSGPLGSGLRLSCEARNAHGKQSAAVLLLPGPGAVGGRAGGRGVGGGSLEPRKASLGVGLEYPGSIPLACPPPAVAPPTLEEESELHYASLTFHRLRPWKPQDPEGSSTTEYSEIKICK